MWKKFNTVNDVNGIKKYASIQSVWQSCDTALIQLCHIIN